MTTDHTTDVTAGDAPVLLAMSTARKSPKSMATAVQLAAERDTGLVAVFALDEDTAEKTVDKLSAEGWIGDSQAAGFYESVIAERRRVGEKKLAEAGRLASERGVPFESAVVSGPFGVVVGGQSEARTPSVVVVTRRKRTQLSRRVLGSVVAELQESLPVEVVVVDEE
jgi:nucleotide-binding universal stress UspA family protein